MTQCAGGCLAVGKTAKAEVDNIIELLGLYWGLVPLEEKHILALGFMKQTNNPGELYQRKSSPVPSSYMAAVVYRK